MTERRCVNFVGGPRTSRSFWLLPICLIWIDHFCEAQQLFEWAFCDKSLPRCLLVCWIEANPWVLLNGTQLRRSCENLSFILVLNFTILNSIHPDLGLERFTKLKENSDAWNIDIDGIEMSHLNIGALSKHGLLTILILIKRSGNCISWQWGPQGRHCDTGLA